MNVKWCTGITHSHTASSHIKITSELLICNRIIQMFHAHTPSFIRINNHNDRNQVSKDYLNDLMPLFQSTLQNATNQMTKIFTIFNELDAFRIIEFIKPLKYFESQCFFSTIVFFFFIHHTHLYGISFSNKQSEFSTSAQTIKSLD